jgi:hypothetical protein
MKCPKCGLINSPSSERCDCGFGFGDGSFVTPAKATIPGENLRRVGCALGVGGMLASIVLGRLFARSLAAGVLSDLLTVAAFIGLAIWIIGTLRKRRAT